MGYDGQLEYHIHNGGTDIDQVLNLGIFLMSLAPCPSAVPPPQGTTSCVLPERSPCHRGAPLMSLAPCPSDECCPSTTTSCVLPERSPWNLGAPLMSLVPCPSDVPPTQPPVFSQRGRPGTLGHP